MGNGQGVAGSQAGQSGSGSQAGQGTTDTGQGTEGQQGTQQQQGQTQQAAIRLDGMLEGETVEQAWSRVNGALETARKQAAGYRQRLNGDGGTGAGTGTQGQQGQQGQGTQGEADRLARLEADLAAERQARRADRIANQLIGALAAEGAQDPALTMRLLDLDTLEVGDDGTVTDPVAAARSLKAKVPALFADLRGSGDGGAGNRTPVDPNDFNAMIRRKAGVA